MEEIRISAKTLDEAKTQALLKLNTSSDHIEFSVIEEGSSGLLGFIGSKPWVISARVKGDAEMSTPAEEEAKPAEEIKAQEPEDHMTAEETNTEEAVLSFADDVKAEEIKDKIEEAETKIIADVKGVEAEAALDVAEAEIAAEAAAEKQEIEPVSEEEAAELTAKGEEFLKSIFKVMDIDAQIKSEFDHDTNEIYYEFSGDDMGVLIGKRGQTLDSLQYLVSLVVNKHRSGYIRVKLDTENYRDRRKSKLEDLAHNIAQKVKRSRRKVELEPMNPYERRIIHSALQNDPYVTTTSEGEEPRRHVVVLLKKDQNRRRYGKSSGYNGKGRSGGKNYSNHGN